MTGRQRRLARSAFVGRCDADDDWSAALLGPLGSDCHGAGLAGVSDQCDGHWVVDLDAQKLGGCDRLRKDWTI